MLSYRTLGWLLWITALALVAGMLLQLPLASMWPTLAGLRPTQWLVWAGINLLIILIGTLRWQVLNRLLGLSMAFLPLLMIRQAGQLISFVTPGPQFGGEPLQVYWLYRQHGAPLSRAVLGLGLDRFFELWLNLSMLVLGVVLLQSVLGFDGAADWPRVLLIPSLVLGGLAGIGQVVFRRPQWLMTRLARSTARWRHSPRLQTLAAHWQNLGEELTTALTRGRPTLWASLALSLLGWIAIVAETAVVLQILGLPVIAAQVVFILVTTRLALLLPLPGGIGTVEAAVIWSFQWLGLPATGALGLIALMRLRDALVLLVGLACLGRLRRVPT